MSPTMVECPTDRRLLELTKRRGEASVRPCTAQETSTGSGPPGRQRFALCASGLTWSMHSG
eukprot:4748762-Pyramimonas_sp.AAC.1